VIFVTMPDHVGCVITCNIPSDIILSEAKNLIIPALR